MLNNTYSILCTFSIILTVLCVYHKESLHMLNKMHSIICTCSTIYLQHCVHTIKNRCTWLTICTFLHVLNKMYSILWRCSTMYLQTIGAHAQQYACSIVCIPYRISVHAQQYVQYYLYMLNNILAALCAYDKESVCIFNKLDIFFANAQQYLQSCVYTIKESVHMLNNMYTFLCPCSTIYLQ